MITKRSITKKPLKTFIESDDEPETNLQDKLLSVQSYHKLKEKGRGLQANKFETVELDFETQAKAKLTHQALLDKQFKSQEQKHENDVINAHMKAYVIEHLSEEGKRHFKSSQENNKINIEESANHLFEIPSQLKVEDTTQQNEDKTVWSVGLAEVPFDILDRLKSVEQTEAAKRIALLSAYAERIKHRIQKKPQS